MIPTRYDALFRSSAPDIPFEFLRALAWNESSMNPSAVSPAGARGLLQIMPVVLGDYNRANATSYANADLYRPEVNITIGAWLLRLIIREYARNHPNTLATDWSDGRWIQLLVLGWNRGFSERAGVGFVVGHLERERMAKRDINAQAVLANAARVGAARALRTDAPLAIRWSSTVVATYARASRHNSAAVQAGVGPAGIAALAILLGLVLRSVLA